MMHREIITRKRSHVIIVGLLFLTSMLYVVEGLEMLNIKMKGFVDTSYIIIILLVSMFLVFEYFSCKVSYRYSIIADKLIINRIFRKHEDNLTSIRINNILYIGKKCNAPREHRGKSTGRYTCSLFTYNSYCCIYKDNGETHMFTFQPSTVFLDRMKKCNPNLKL